MYTERFLFKTENKLSVEHYVPTKQSKTYENEILKNSIIETECNTQQHRKAT